MIKLLEYEEIQAGVSSCLVVVSHIISRNIFDQGLNWYKICPFSRKMKEKTRIELMIQVKIL